MLLSRKSITPKIASRKMLLFIFDSPSVLSVKIIGTSITLKPNFTEVSIFSVMWSEHCSYKSSRPYLRRLPVEGANVLQGPGENAGVIDIGDGLAVVFKIESHNHPSFIEPRQGAATGVGGIMRDIFTMGARPIALMNSLRFLMRYVIIRSIIRNFRHKHTNR